MEEIEILEIFWDALDPGENDDDSRVSEERWEMLYDHGMVDSKRIPKERWIGALKALPITEGLHLLKRTDLPKISRFFYKGAIKKPFDPHRLKDGLRTLPWVQEMYQKVLKFETTLKQAEWNQLIETEINQRFKVDENYRFNNAFKDWVAELLEAKPSPLRRLEIWVFVGNPLEDVPPVSPGSSGAPSTSTVIHDSFVTGDEKGRKIRKIEKVFYEGEKHPPVSDDEALSFLDELEGLEDDPESPLK